MCRAFPLPTNVHRGPKVPIARASFTASPKSNAAVAGISALQHQLKLTHCVPSLRSFSCLRVQLFLPGWKLVSCHGRRLRSFAFFYASAQRTKLLNVTS